MAIKAAYSHKMEHKTGSILSGALANFTILEDNPVTCDPLKIRDVAAWGIVYEGRVLPITQAPDSEALKTRIDQGDEDLARIRAIKPAL